MLPYTQRGLSLASAARGGNREGPPPTGPRPTLLPAGVGPLSARAPRPCTPHLLFLPAVPPFDHSTITPRRCLGGPCAERPVGAGVQTWACSWAIEDGRPSHDTDLWVASSVLLPKASPQPQTIPTSHVLLTSTAYSSGGPSCPSQAELVQFIKSFLRAHPRERQCLVAAAATEGPGRLCTGGDDEKVCQMERGLGEHDRGAQTVLGQRARLGPQLRVKELG